MTAPASLSAAKAYLERIRLAAERTGMTECETLLDEMVATFEEAAREREGMREALEKIDGEGPVKEPRITWTSTDLDEAFQEGACRGRWELAQIALTALGGSNVR